MTVASPNSTASPAAPWLRRSDWSSGIIRDNLVGRTIFVWVFAVLWITATIPMCVDVLGEIGRHNFKHVGFAAIFLVIGFGMIIWAIRSAFRAAKFGRSKFFLETLPASPGGSLAGTIRVTRVVNCETPMQLRLVRVHRTRSKSNQRKDEAYFEVDDWQSTQTLDRLPHTAAGTEIPVFFNIPADAKPWDDTNRNDQMVWRLEARAKSAGTNYFAQFDVPVFVSSGAPTIQKDLAADYRHKEIPVPAERTREPGIDVRPLPGGGLQIGFTAGRNKKAAGIMSFFFLLMTGIAFGMCVVAHGESNLFFALVWYVGGAGLIGLFALVMLFAAICSVFVSSEITVSHGTAQLTTGIGFLRRHRTFTAADIIAVTHNSSGSAGGQPFYAVEFKTPKGLIIRVGDYIHSQDYAARLASDIAKRLGIANE